MKTRSLPQLSGVLFKLVSLTVSLGMGIPLSLWSSTTVSRIPQLDGTSSMSRFLGVGDDVLVIPEEENGVLWQLEFDGWEWVPVAEHPIADWLGYSRIHTHSIYPIGEEVLVMDSSPVYEGFRPARATVLQRVDGLFEPVQTVSLESKLTDPDIWDVFALDVIPTPEALVFRNQVNFLGYGGRLWGHTFIKTPAGWVAGADREFPTGYWWPLYSVREADGIHLFHLEMTSGYGFIPQTFAMVENLVDEVSWTELSRTSFQLNEQWNGIYNGMRGLLSPDGMSLLAFERDFADLPLRGLEFRTTVDGWSFVGLVEESLPDATDLYILQIADGYALLRRGEVSVGGEATDLQHYHYLKYTNGQWQIEGDLPSHRWLQGYYNDGISYILGSEWLTIFDRRFYQPATWGARSYSLEDFNPRLVKWFRDSTTVDAGTEWIPGFGFFDPMLSNVPEGMWAWHWNMGWVFLAGREENGFWFYSETFGWAWFSKDLYDYQAKPSWLYSWSHQDYLWCLTDSRSPYFFYSENFGEWLTDTRAPGLDQQVVEDVIATVSAELAEEGVTLDVDYENRWATFTYSEIVDGKNVTVRLYANWLYDTDFGYCSQARFEIDLSAMDIIMNGETTSITTYDLWTEAALLLPARLIIDYIFYSPDSGVAIERTQFNNFTWSAPVRERF